MAAANVSSSGSMWGTPAMKKRSTFLGQEVLGRFNTQQAEMRFLGIKTENIFLFDFL